MKMMRRGVCTAEEEGVAVTVGGSAGGRASGEGVSTSGAFKSLPGAASVRLVAPASGWRSVDARRRAACVHACRWTMGVKLAPPQHHVLVRERAVA